MKYLFLILTSVCFAQTIPEALENKKSEAATIATNLKASSNSVIVIDPKARAKDLTQAFAMLRKEKPSLRISVATVHGVLNGVTDLQASSGGTLIILKLLSSQGSQTNIIPVEQIVEIGYSP